MNSITNTLWSNILSVSSHLKLPFDILPFTTLNEKLDINADAVLLPNEMPGMRYLAIGNGGHRAEVGQDGFALTSPIDHASDHAALYNQIPFVLRRPNDDLTAGQRGRYALRKLVEYDGIEYIAYYLKRLDMTDVLVQPKITTIVDDESVTLPYTPTSDALNPVPPEIPPSGASTTSGEYLSASAVISLPFNEWDVQELFNVANIIYGDERYAVISEFAFCSAVDRQVSIATQLGQISFMEAVACQVCSFVQAHYEMVYHNQGFDFRIEVGGADALLGLITAP